MLGTSLVSSSTAILAFAVVLFLPKRYWPASPLLVELLGENVEVHEVSEGSVRESGLEAKKVVHVCLSA